MKTIIKIKSLALMEGDKKEIDAAIGMYSTGLILELADGRIMLHTSTDPIVPFNEFNPKNPADLEQLKLLLADQPLTYQPNL